MVINLLVTRELSVSLCVSCAFIKHEDMLLEGALLFAITAHLRRLAGLGRRRRRRALVLLASG
jgi:hypothetical protein